MASTFFDSFLPLAAQSAAQMGPAGMQGSLQGHELFQQLAMQDVQRRQAEQQLQQQGQAFPLQQQQLQQQIRMGAAPQWQTRQGGTQQELVDPFTGQVSQSRQIPVVKDPQQEAYWSAKAKEAEAMTDALRGSGGLKLPGTMQEVILRKLAQGIPLSQSEKEALQYMSASRPSVTEVIDPTDASKSVKIDARTGRVIGTAPRSMETFDQDTLSRKADQFLAGDTSVFQNLGSGYAGQQNRQNLEQAITKKGAEQGISGQEIAARIADLSGVKAGMRILGGRTAQFGMAQKEFDAMADVLLEASELVPRGSFMPWNQLQMSIQKKFGDEGVTALEAAVNSTVNIYTRAVSPTGVATEGMRNEARNLIQSAMTKGQLKGQIELMRKEMAAAGGAPGAVQGELRSMIPGATGVQKPEKPLEKLSAKPKMPVPSKSDDSGKGTALEWYKSLPPDTQSVMNTYYKNWKSGNVSDEQFRNDALSILGDFPETRGYVDKLMALKQKK